MTQNTDTAWLSFYLRDHMAGATAGVNLFDRVARGHSDYEVRTQVARLCAQVQQDRTSLSRIMTTLGIRAVPITMLTAVLGEVVGRFKPNGALSGRSPGADVLELEALVAAVQGKAQLWETLQGQAINDSRLDADQLRDLGDRARDQRHILLNLHARVVGAQPAE